MSTTPPRVCITCGEFEDSAWVTAKCEFEAAAPAAAYEAVVQTYPHGSYGGTRKVGGKRASLICRHAHTTPEDAALCADRITAEYNAR
jgi:hypothetical protein